MATESLVRRLISFFKRPDALNYDRTTPVKNVYDDIEPQSPPSVPDSARVASPATTMVSRPSPLDGMMDGAAPMPGHASRLDALVMRALLQFSAQNGCVLRYRGDGRMQYCTGRDVHGRYAPPAVVDPDRRAVFRTVDSGRSQLFVDTKNEHTAISVLCGPLWVDNRVVGVLYLANPARSRLHRGVFDLFCEQAARMMGTEVG